MSEVCAEEDITCISPAGLVDELKVERTDDMAAGSICAKQVSSANTVSLLAYVIENSADDG